MDSVRLTVHDTYKPGDQPPSGYIAWHDWAEVQQAAGLKQTQCTLCKKWRFPQELNQTNSCLTGCSKD